jgi:hypothetical protein
MLASNGRVDGGLTHSHGLIIIHSSEVEEQCIYAVIHIYSFFTDLTISSASPKKTSQGTKPYKKAGKFRLANPHF